MPGRIDKVELVLLAVFGLIVECHTLGLDRDASLTLNIHGIKHLSRHFALCQASTLLNESVCQSGFAVVNVGNNGKVSNVADVCHRRGVLQ